MNTQRTTTLKAAAPLLAAAVLLGGIGSAGLGMSAAAPAHAAGSSVNAGSLFQQTKGSPTVTSVKVKEASALAEYGVAIDTSSPQLLLEGGLPISVDDDKARQKLKLGDERFLLTAEAPTPGLGTVNQLKNAPELTPVGFWDADTYKGKSFGVMYPLDEVTSHFPDGSNLDVDRVWTQYDVTPGGTKTDRTTSFTSTAYSNAEWNFTDYSDSDDKIFTDAGYVGVKSKGSLGHFNLKSGKQTLEVKKLLVSTTDSKSRVLTPITLEVEVDIPENRLPDFSESVNGVQLRLKVDKGATHGSALKVDDKLFTPPGADTFEVGLKEEGGQVILTGDGNHSAFNAFVDSKATGHPDLAENEALLTVGSSSGGFGLKLPGVEVPARVSKGDTFSGTWNGKPVIVEVTDFSVSSSAGPDDATSTLWTKTFKLTFPEGTQLQSSIGGSIGGTIFPEASRSQPALYVEATCENGNTPKLGGAVYNGSFMGTQMIPEDACDSGSSTPPKDTPPKQQPPKEQPPKKQQPPKEQPPTETYKPFEPKTGLGAWDRVWDSIRGIFR